MLETHHPYVAGNNNLSERLSHKQRFILPPAARRNGKYTQTCLTSSRRKWYRGVASDLVEAEVPVHDGLEDSRERAVVELEEAKDVEVPQKPRGDVVPAPAGGPHRAHDDRVDNRLPRHVLQVVPVC